ncbi:MAG: ATP-binding cassette domain-containing protein [Oscillospiraceae bacterium]|jgi:ABC-type lipoprotein export system ATPase subunit|nr:ATP-binding cassette domain-containing protein [Oscillospiraceae bacterium]
MNIKLNGISKQYISKTNVVNVISSFNYNFESPGMYLIKGESGKGKTTLLSIIGLLDDPSSGNIYFDDNRVDNISSRKKCLLRKEKISFVFQESCLMDNMTVYENISLPFEETGNKNDLDTKLQDILDKLKLSHRKNHIAKKLSGGEKQRISFARALLKSHEILILDEPISNLDKENSEIIIETLKIIKKNTLIIVTCHTNHFDELCDNIIEL